MMDALEEIGLQSSAKENNWRKKKGAEKIPRGVDKVKTVKTLVMIGLLGVLQNEFLDFFHRVIHRKKKKINAQKRNFRNVFYN